jgi:hypothetical protein
VAVVNEMAGSIDTQTTALFWVRTASAEAFFLAGWIFVSAGAVVQRQSF